MTEPVTLALAALKSETCACGGEKPRRTSFCKKCYVLLPQKLRNQLYEPFSEGYADHYVEAIEWLKANTTRVWR